MDFKIIWSDEAIADLNDICSYIARQDSEAALRMGNGTLTTLGFSVSFPSLDQHIHEEHGGRCEKLSFGRTASSTMYPSSHTGSTFCMSGMGRAMSPSSERPNQAAPADGGTARQSRIGRSRPAAAEPQR